MFLSFLALVSNDASICSVYDRTCAQGRQGSPSITSHLTSNQTKVRPVFAFTIVTKSIIPVSEVMYFAAGIWMVRTKSRFMLISNNICVIEFRFIELKVIPYTCIIICCKQLVYKRMLKGVMYSPFAYKAVRNSQFLPDFDCIKMKYGDVPLSIYGTKSETTSVRKHLVILKYLT